jgi:hypothetical protein
MLTQIADAFWEVAMWLVSIIPVPTITLPDIAALTAQMGVLASVLLPMNSVRTALGVALGLLTLRIALIGVRYVLLVVRGVSA